MKNKEKQQNFAKKLGIFALMVILFLPGVGFAQDGGNGDKCDGLSQSLCYSYEKNGEKICEWDPMNNVCYEKGLDFECSLKKSWAGCFLKKGCVWLSGNNKDKGKCVSRSMKYITKSSWKVDDCFVKWNPCRVHDEQGQCVGGYEKDEKNSHNDWEYKYFVKDLESYSYEKKDGSVDSKTNVGEACEAVIKSGYEICDYSHWMNSRGKRKCREFFRKKAKAEKAYCQEMAENDWQRSIKDYEARETRRLALEKCNTISYTEALYDGPVFDGPGLRGGAIMAQRELSNSISKQRDIKKLIISWAKFALEIAAVVAVIAIIYAGFRYITDLGDGSGVEAAKKIIIWTVVGLLVILSSYAIVNTVMKARFGEDGGRTSFINKIIT